jgi:hypothetical protein
MAKAKQAVKARVLVDGRFGRINEVIELEQSEVDEAVKSGEVDTSPDAVAYAEKEA